MNIEEGCLAIIIRSNAGNEGKVVTVGKFLGRVKDLRNDCYYRGNDYREVDIELNSTYGGKVNYTRESWLLRIDGLKEDESVFHEEEEMVTND